MNPDSSFQVHNCNIVSSKSTKTTMSKAVSVLMGEKVKGGM